MDQRNAENTHHIHDRISEQGYSSPHPEEGRSPSANLANYSNHHIYPAVSPYATSTKNQHHLSATQFYHPVSTYDLSGVALYNCYNAGSHNAYQFALNGDFFFPMHNGLANQFAQSAPAATGVITNERFSQNSHVGIEGNTNEHNGNYEFANNPRVAYNSEHPEVVTGVLANVPANPDLSSASSRPLHNKEPTQNGFTVSSPAEVHRSERSRHNNINLQQRPEFLYNDYDGQVLQPSSFGWGQQHENYYHGQSCYNWNYLNPMSYVNGRHLQSQAVDSINIQMQEYPTFVSHPSPFSDQQRHLSYVQSMQVHSHDQNTQTVVPSYWHPFSNLQASSAHRQVDAVNSVNRSLRAPSFVPRVFNRVLPGPSEEYEDVDPYADGVSDEHGGMRLDIEEMSYEELLALGEKIGYVSTGLSEDLISKNLKTSVCASPALSLLDLSSRLLNEKCGICLVDYEEQERIGTLDCGHSYHADCIKEWLLIKNLCPICKASALASDRKE